MKKTSLLMAVFVLSSASAFASDLNIRLTPANQFVPATDQDLSTSTFPRPVYPVYPVYPGYPVYRPVPVYPVQPVQPGPDYPEYPTQPAPVPSPIPAPVPGPVVDPVAPPPGYPHYGYTVACYAQNYDGVTFQVSAYNPNYAQDLAMRACYDYGSDHCDPLGCRNY